jgi:hypothetical protein
MNRVLGAGLILAALVGCVDSGRYRDDPDNSCEDQCDAEGDIQCEGARFRTCLLMLNGCLDWHSAQDCPNGGSCDASKHECVEPCTNQCEKDARRCTNSGQVQRCATAPSGCFEWGDAEPCPSGSVCKGGDAVCAPCTDACQSGDTRCAGSQIQQCITAPNGCRDWAIPSNCPSAKSCIGSPGICVACQSDCTSPGLTRCSGTLVQVCQQVSAGCLKWAAPTACAGSSVCDATISRCVSDPCNGVPVQGRCSGSTTVEYCAVASGSGQPELRIFNCPVGKACVDSVNGASCQLAGVCLPGETKCLTSTQLQVCDGSGQWTTQNCTNAVCQDTALGSSCTPISTSRSLSGTLSYEARKPRSDYSDWESSPYATPLAGITILSYQGQNVIDTVTTDSAGAFKVKVPSSPTSNDRVVAVAARSDTQGKLLFFVADPGFSSGGEYDPGDVGTKSRIWSWSWQTNALGTSATLKIQEKDGSGAARIFDILRQGHSSTATEYGKTGLSLVAWIGYGTSWSCGACFAPWPVTAVGYNMDSQIWFPADSNQSYWSDAVTAHELGHWVMDSYGTSPNEGGTHYIGNPTFPGQAWSEGFATWFSAEVRNLPYYYDKQGGSMFWLNIDARTYDGGITWQRPKPANGLLQRIDENEVSSMLWKMSNSSSSAYGQVLKALAAPKMNRSPWARGYTRHTWDLSGSSLVNVNDTKEPKPMLADFLDTLMCTGFSKSVVDSATNPATAYPYPSSSPLCQ